MGSRAFDTPLEQHRANGASNEERTGDRDLYFSDLMRRPGNPPEDQIFCNIRSCDFDPTLFCHVCKVPVFMTEAMRGSAIARESKGTTYMEAVARRLQIKAYLIRRDVMGLWITSLPDRSRELGPLTEEAFVAWCHE